ncbi:MutS-related protein [Pseudobacter ginsenosidimutans]|uniref:MutS-like protein n=1 Tax=Pseudobacter ginsenosidimutans TaxID=661488 RepID=A0A4Q7MT56_9BACT|nr:DNA mismatch repair protein [Pseudobacter ginsenosidimutans]QEC41540.1 DNA mismatch repair protein [Pseudobacter ginsenosidimutans]RZS71678.1 MutS-like protein [Pseudobacter ginsenosidimutans]
MSFITDKQTLADLNLLGKYKIGSMFNIFNRVKTRGGELLLEEMFKTPLTDADAINHRTNCIAYLQQLNLKLEIDPELAEMASQYLTEPRPGSRVSCVLGAYKGKFQEMMYKSQKYYLQQRRIYAVQEVLVSASKLLGQLIRNGIQDNPCKAMQDKLDKIINAPALRHLKAKYPYTVGQTADCQFLFLNKFRQSLEELLQLLYEFDVFISVAQVAADKGFIYAQALATDSNGLINVDNLRHPSLSNAKGNTITLSKEENLLFLTGANMAGKSTWMKTLGVSFYLAHMGFPVAANKMSFMVMEGIFTSINVPDDLSLGWSHFYAEVMRVKEVSRQVSNGKKLFILFDELFKGTNVKDAFDATLVVTQKLARYRSCMFVISTHIIEVGEALKGTLNIQFGYMPTIMKGAVPHYTYQLTQGITTDRQGMIILENEKILELLA